MEAHPVDRIVNPISLIIEVIGSVVLQNYCLKARQLLRT